MYSSGILMVIAGPSGAGKTTIARHMVSTFSDAVFSVSSTTREPRGEEVHGRDYNFLSADEFQKRVNDGFFLEWARVHGNCYGTDGEWVREQLALGRSVILDIDVQGAVMVKEKIPSAVLVFVLPGSREILLERLQGRSTDSSETVARRMDAASGEVAALGAFDYFIQNGELDSTLEAAEVIYRSERMSLRVCGWPASAVEYDPDHFRGLDFWRGKRVVVSSGPTREMIDSVRFVSNRSSGLMGVSLAEAFQTAGARVTLVSGPAKHSVPPGSVELTMVESAEQMLHEIDRSTRGADLLVMAAAVSDYTPAGRYSGKIRRRGEDLELTLKPTADILASLALDCPVLAFALEYGDEAEDSAGDKMRRKGADAVFLNRGDIPGQGMDSTDNAGLLIFNSGSEPVQIHRGSKKHVAMGIAAAMGREFERRDLVRS